MGNGASHGIVRVALVHATRGAVLLDALHAFVARDAKPAVEWVAAAKQADLVVYVVVAGNRFDPVQRLIDLHEAGATLPTCPQRPVVDSEEAALPAGAVEYAADSATPAGHTTIVLAVRPKLEGLTPSHLGGLPVFHMLLDPVSGNVVVREPDSSAQWLLTAINGL